jgi:hypothetical protein
MALRRLAFVPISLRSQAGVAAPQGGDVELRLFPRVSIVFSCDAEKDRGGRRRRGWSPGADGLGRVG